MPPDPLQFQEPQYAQPETSSGPTGIMGLVIRWGLAKDEKTATYALVGVAIAAVLLAVLVPSVIGRSSGPRVPQSLIDAETPPSAPAAN